MKRPCLFLSLLCVAACLSLHVKAETSVVNNEPDSVYLFSYSKADGTGGLRFAWSGDGAQWFSVADGWGYLSSDFGPWATGMKLLLNPHLVQTRADGQWHCLWEVTSSGKTFAYAASPDLLQWKPQHYFDRSDYANYMPDEVYSTSIQTIRLGNTELTGWTQRVAFAVVERLIAHAERRKYRSSLNAERTAQDSTRFANLNEPIEATVSLVADEAKPISSQLIGIFFEDINYGADGGLYAELVQNRDFEYSWRDGAGERWNSQYAWSISGGRATLSIDTLRPIHENNPHYVTLQIKEAGAALRNSGYDGIPVKQGEKYLFSLFARIPSGSKGGKVAVRLLDEQGAEVASATLSVSSKDWKKQQVTLTAKATAQAATLSIEPQQTGAYQLDMVSLFPQATFKGRQNGLRADLAQTLADLHPRFVRFPGGCVAHGDGIDNIYDWKGSIGSLEARKPLRNLWGYHQTRGLGYFEYFQFCEDIGAEPVPVLAAGVPCQNSGTHTFYSDTELGHYGQQGGIPMEEMEQYVQDILDLIEYANGDARRTTWGALRAEAGHPEPFNLKYIGIGNEDMMSTVFEERFRMIYQAVKERCPEITVIGTAGPYCEGSDYDEGWRLAAELDVPIVDEHYYVEPGWMVNNQDFYDRYDRSKSKVYLGEYAAHLPGRPSNVETAVTEALYLTSVERNADVVVMTSYAPLLAKEGHTQWNPDLIYFNNNEVKPTVGYYTQQMYGQNAGSEYLPADIALSDNRDDVRKRVGVSVTRDTISGDYIVKLANLLPVEVNATINPGATALPFTGTKTVLTGRPDDRAARPVTVPFSANSDTLSYTMPAYSFTVLRLSASR